LAKKAEKFQKDITASESLAAHLASTKQGIYHVALAQKIFTAAA
jgi:hypothetical protein